MISSFLTDRSQVVKIDHATSQPLGCDMGVPQGSILGPLLFILYINDLPQVCNYSKCLMYADDILLFLSDSNPDTINSELSSELQSLHEWLNDNHLTINVTKTECMYFHSSRKHLSFTSPIILSNQSLVIA